MTHLIRKRFRGFDFAYWMIDNKAPKTILFVHGYNSSSDLALPLENLTKNFNLVSLNLPGSLHLPEPDEPLTGELFKTYLTTFLDRICPFEKVILLGHSLAGITISALAEHPAVEALVYLASVHPGIVHSASFNQLAKSFELPEQERQIQLKNYLASHPEMEEIFAHRQRYQQIIKHNLLNRAYLNHDLDRDYRQSLAKPTFFLIGQHDYVIETSCFVSYVQEQLKRPVSVVPAAYHNPIKDQPQLISAWLSQLVKNLELDNLVAPVFPNRT